MQHTTKIVGTTEKKKGPEDYDYLMKVVLMGDHGVGKTNILDRYTKGEFHFQEQSVTSEFGNKTITLDDGTRVKLQIWTASADHKDRLDSHLRGAAGVIHVYDQTNASTFDHAVNEWLKIGQCNFPNAVTALVGNKKDEQGMAVIQLDQARAVGDQNSINIVSECSAQSGENLDATFKEIATQHVYRLTHPKEEKSTSEEDYISQYKYTLSSYLRNQIKRLEDKGYNEETHQKLSLFKQILKKVATSDMEGLEDSVRILKEATINHTSSGVKGFFDRMSRYPKSYNELNDIFDDSNKLKNSNLGSAQKHYK